MTETSEQLADAIGVSQQLAYQTAAINSLKELVQAELTAQEKWVASKFADLDKRSDQLDAERATALAAALASAEKAVDAALTAAKTAVDKAEVENVNWRKTTNEWRGAFTDREKAFMPRLEAEAADRVMNTLLTSLTTRVDRTEAGDNGASGRQAVIIGYAISFFTLVVAIAASIVLALKH